MTTQPTVTVTAVADWTDTHPIRSEYASLDEALAVAAEYRAAGFVAKVWVAR